MRCQKGYKISSSEHGLKEYEKCNFLHIHLLNSIIDNEAVGLKATIWREAKTEVHVNYGTVLYDYPCIFITTTIQDHKRLNISSSM